MRTPSMIYQINWNLSYN